MKLNFSINKFYSYIIAFLLLLDGSSMWQLSGVINISNTKAKLILIFFCILSILSLRDIKFSDYFIKMIMFITIYLIIYILISGYNISYFFNAFGVVFVVLIVYTYTMMRYHLIGDLAKAFVNIWIIIAIITSFLWLFGSIFHIIPLTTSTYDWSDRFLNTYTFHNIYYENPVQNTTLFGKVIARNTGIYAEAPGFSNYFLYALALEMAFFKHEKGYKLKLFVLFVTSLTTLSTKTIIFLVLIFIINYLFSVKNNKSVFTKLIRIFISIILPLVGLFILIVTLQTKSNTGSFSIRIDDVISEVKTWKDYPIFGSGIGNTEPIINHFSVKRDNNALSMGLTLLLAQGGIWLTSLYISPLILILIKSEKRFFKKSIFLFGLAVLINLVISNIILSSSFLIILASGYAFLGLTISEREQIERNFSEVSFSETT
ncbi:hypothetical protein [Streptococcus gallolyticus]|uniref:Uncharacterized protein n=1 Tax=Streptococcus gallolyticus TaxID=315405 RepID=A0A1H9QDB9_9STRE|nr:hypothetical protein [Streptococcus gallolyticus]SER57803.1 hypothetical protein SAMN04487840_105100 [Streptococcus gallolyticus]